MQFAIPNADPVATLTFEDVVTVDISTFAETDYISLSLPEFETEKYKLSETFIDFTSNAKGNFGVGPTDSLPFSAGSFVGTQENGDTELRFGIGELVNIDKSAITGVRFRFLTSESATFRCLSIRACAQSWKYAPIDFNTLWHRVDRPPSPNASSATRTNLIDNPSFEVNTTGWSVSSAGFTEVSKTQEEAPDVMTNEHNLWSCRVKAKKDATTTQRFLVIETKSGTEGFPVVAGHTYSMSGYLFMNDPPSNTTSFRSPKNLFTELYWYDESGAAVIEFPTPSEYQIGKEELTRVSHTEEAPAGAAFVKVRFSSWTDTTSDVIDFYVDQVQLEETSAPTAYFDGNYRGAWWNGEANASSSSTPETTFPTEGGTEFPILFRSNRLTGFSDPEPVNLSVGALFTTGSLTGAAGSRKNELALYFRDIPTDNQTMIEMDTRSMAFLDSQDKQPDYGRALFNARVQEEIDLYDQEELDGKTQYNLERKRDESEHTWIECRLKWGAEEASNKLEFRDADGFGYSWTEFDLEASEAAELDKGKYLLIVTVLDDHMEAAIYQANQIGQIVSQTPVVETGKIQNDNIVKRRRGRFGWQASLIDGDAHIDNIKTRGANFGEMISKPYRSITPVKGAQIFSGATADLELIEEFERTQPEYMSLTLDPAASSTGKAIRVDTSPLKPLQGISTNTFLIDDPKNIRISFDIKFPASEIPGGGLLSFILGPNEVAYPINLSAFSYGIWSHVRVNLPEEIYQTGGYKLVLMQTLPVVATSWWIENLSAKTYSVKWSARPTQADPWGIEPTDWLEAGNTLNEANGGIVFSETGAGLQVRAQALRQDAEITEFRVVPQYATLGNIVFKD